MLFSTPTQFAVLALLFVAGWLFGLASHPGGRKWKERYLAERDAHAANRRTAETSVAAANARTAEVSRENTRLAETTPVAATTIRDDRVVAHPSVVTAPVAPAPLTTARPAYPATDYAARERRGWFDWTPRPR
jgi:hypothetical protein